MAQAWFKYTPASPSRTVTSMAAGDQDENVRYYLFEVDKANPIRALGGGIIDFEEGFWHGACQQDGVDIKALFNWSRPTYMGKVTSEEDADVEVDVEVNEGTVLWEAMKTGKSKVGGVWLAGVKYKIIRAQDQDLNNKSRKTLQIMKDKIGFIITQTDWAFYVAYFDEEKGTNARAAQVAIFDLANYLATDENWQ